MSKSKQNEPSEQSWRFGVTVEALTGKPLEQPNVASSIDLIGPSRKRLRGHEATSASRSGVPRTVCPRTRAPGKARAADRLEPGARMASRGALPPACALLMFLNDAETLTS